MSRITWGGHWLGVQVAMLLPSKERIQALVFSPHPLVIDGLRDKLSPTRLALRAVPVRYSLTPCIEPLQAPAGCVCLVDACFPQAATEALVAAVQSSCEEPRTLVLADEISEPFAFAMLRLRVKGLLTYAQADAQICPAAEALAEGGSWLPRGLLGAFLDSLLGSANETRSPGGLSRREQEVLAPLLQNLTNKEIAVRLNISERTVKFHVSNLLSKFSVQRRADLLVQSLGRFAS